MKKLFLMAACAAMFAACNQSQNADSESSAQIDSLQNIINNKDNEINDMMNTFNEIQEGFELINQAEGRVSMLSKSPENNSNVENIRENMAFIQERLEENKKQIEDLQNKLNNSSINSKKLQETINNLMSQLDEKNKEIEELRAQLAQKDVQIAALGDTVSSLRDENRQVTEKKEQTERIASNQDKQLNTAYYVFGTSKELKEHKILVKGDVLTTNTFDKEYFTKIDIRKTTVIPLSSKYAKLLTSHPSGTYSLLKDSKGEYTLRITDPTKFWSVSKYLVIRVK